MGEEKYLSEIEFWKLVAMGAIFLFQVAIGFFGKSYFNRLDKKMDSMDLKIDELSSDHTETRTVVREHAIRLQNLEKI